VILQKTAYFSIIQSLTVEERNLLPEGGEKVIAVSDSKVTRNVLVNKTTLFKDNPAVQAKRPRVPKGKNKLAEAAFRPR